MPAYPKSVAEIATIIQHQSYRASQAQTPYQNLNGWPQQKLLIIQATRHSSKKNMPEMKGISNFKGDVLCHSSEFAGAKAKSKGNRFNLSFYKATYLAQARKEQKLGGPSKHIITHVVIVRDKPPMPPVPDINLGYLDREPGDTKKQTRKLS
ncbi:hypothetical protein FDECE_722 [Fusarium decemcellulare]|nr:hypothetical protein FDECE_722 [Fusarium decemcellulare]